MAMAVLTMVSEQLRGPRATPQEPVNLSDCTGWAHHPETRVGEAGLIG